MFESGKLVLARYNSGQRTLTGQEAFNAILSNRLTIARIVGVAPALIVAYSGLASGVLAYSGLTATKPNLEGLQSAFLRQQQSGVIRCYLDSQIEVFFLIHRGREVGIFGPQPIYPQLWRRLVPDMDVFWQNKAARIEVYISPRPEKISLSSTEASMETTKPSELDPRQLMYRSLQQLFNLVCQISSPKNAIENLLSVANQGNRLYPILQPVTQASLRPDNSLEIDRTALAKYQTNTSQTELVSAYQYLLNNFAEIYIQQVGREIFRQLAQLALGQDADKLAQFGGQLDFLKAKEDLSSIAKGELVATEVSQKNSSSRKFEESAFDF